MKKIITLITVLLLALTCFACGEPIQLEAPANLNITENGLITWDKVDNATSYVVFIDYITREDVTETVESTSYQVADISSDFKYQVTATASDCLEGKTDALEFKAETIIIPVPPIDDPIIIGINGASEVKSGKSITLTANVTGAEEDSSVTWSIEEDTEDAKISQDGVLTASNVDGDKVVTVVARSNEKSEYFGKKIITIVSQTILTQEMLDALEIEKISFEGYVNISLYGGLYETLTRTYTTVIKTAMDGENWYAEYENASVGTTVGLYYKNHLNKACQVGVSFMNDEEYFPMLNENNEEVTWFDSGLYNSFRDLTVDDFKFNEETWRYEYVGLDKTLPNRIVASANPYDFVPTGFSLIIEEGEVMGIYSKSEDDYTILEGYKAIQELTVAVNFGETVDVPTIQKYSHEEIHDELGEAIENMRALKSYTLDFKEITASYLTTGYVQQGFKEIVSEENCYFRPYSVSYDAYGVEVHDEDEDSAYGFKKISDDLYNAYMQLAPDEEGSISEDLYRATRAYQKDFSNARPSFAFAPELFRRYYTDEEDGTVTYYVDSLMSSVATTFYYGMGNDINLYGIFATEANPSTSEAFTPYVVVKDGYITEACFYFYLGSIYGVVELKYSDFNSAELPEDVTVDFETRQVPSKWEELTIYVSNDGGSTTDDEEVNALVYLKEMFENENIGEIMPFFGEPLGDTYGFGLTTIHKPIESEKAEFSVQFYYDVPLDINYTIDSSLRAVGNYLLGLGFVKNRYDEYYKDGIWIAPVDSSLDLVIYVWKGTAPSIE